jgi:AraC family transcriptional activator of pobA
MKRDKEKAHTVILFEANRTVKFPALVLARYHTHIFCLGGKLEFYFNERSFVCYAGEFVFWFAESKLKKLRFSKDFKATVLLVEKNFLNDNYPDLSLSIDAALHSKENPVLHLHEKKHKQKVILNFQLLYDKYSEKEHRYYKEVLKGQMQLFLLEMWHIFDKEYEHRRRTLQSGTIYERFMQLIRDHCMKHREVQFYADQLHITSKHLNHVCKKTTGTTASAWIQRYVKERIIFLLQKQDLNITEMANQMEFSSTSFFTRYVKKVLGVTPSGYRSRLN